MDQGRMSQMRVSAGSAGCVAASARSAGASGSEEGGASMSHARVVCGATSAGWMRTWLAAYESESNEEKDAKDAGESGTKGCFCGSCCAYCRWGGVVGPGEDARDALERAGEGGMSKWTRFVVAGIVGEEGMWLRLRLKSKAGRLDSITTSGRDLSEFVTRQLDMTQHVHHQVTTPPFQSCYPLRFLPKNGLCGRADPLGQLESRGKESERKIDLSLRHLPALLPRREPLRSGEGRSSGQPGPSATRATYTQLVELPVSVTTERVFHSGLAVNPPATCPFGLALGPRCAPPPNQFQFVPTPGAAASGAPRSISSPRRAGRDRCFGPVTFQFSAAFCHIRSFGVTICFHVIQ
ncbi:predicted protein [Postia placenta Mad-698-R]|nr:predicted protein [Postia placenta Mad-698-R]